MSQPSSDSPLHVLDYLRVLSVRWPFIVLIFVLVVLTTSVITFLLPKQYDSAALIQVQQNADFEIFQQRGAVGWDPRFVSTQFEIIQSRDILRPVVEQLKLAESWAEEYEIKSEGLIFRKLESMMSLQEVRNTDLISITVRSPEPEEAAAIANAIADEYKKARIREQQDWAGRSLSTLKEEVEKQRKKTEELRKIAEDIRVQYQINDLNPESVEDPMQASERVLLNVEEQVSDQRLSVAALRAKSRLLAEMTDDQIMRTIATLGVEDQTILQILPLFQEAASEESRLLESGLGSDHPRVQAQQAKTQTYSDQLNSQIQSLRVALTANLSIEEEALSNLEEKLTESRTEQQESKTKSARYFEAKNNLIQAKSILDAVEQRFFTEMMQRSMPMSPAIIWDSAEVPEFPSRPKVFLNIVIGVFFGLLLGLGSAFLIEYLDTSVKTMDDIERYFGLPVLAVVPKGIGVLLDLPADAMDGEPYRILRTNIEFNRKDLNKNCMTLVSGGAGEGKSTTLVNLAFAFAQSGLRTLVVDADLRRPTQHKIFDRPNTKGLTDHLTKDVSIDELIQDTKIENLQLITSGRSPAGSVAMLNSRRMETMIADLKQRFDMVLVDAPPILGVSDSSVIVRAVDMTVLVIQHRRFPRGMLMRVKNAVINAGGDLLGAVLNNVDIRLDQYYQYQTNYYAYHEEGKPSSATGRPPKPAKSKKPAREELLAGRPTNSGDY